MIQHYPDSKPFYETLSNFLDIPAEQIIVTSGIDEAIRNILILNCTGSRPFFTNAPAYAMYKVYGEILNVECISFQPLPENFVNPDELISKIPENVGVVFIANPSQPVENCYDIPQLETVANYCNSILRSFKL